MAQETDRPLSVGEVAELLHVSPATVVGYADKGQLKFWRLPSGVRRFRRADVEPFMAPVDEPETAA